MFRRLPHTLPQDPVFAATLGELGYQVNDQDQIRQIKNPEQKYQFRVNANDRVNDVYKDSMNSMLSPATQSSLVRAYRLLSLHEEPGSRPSA